METKLEQLGNIHNSLVNGQIKQMTQQIDEFGLYDFFDEYYNYLLNSYESKESILDYFVDCVNSYHRIKNR